MNNFILSFINIIYIKYVISSIIKHSSIVLLLNLFYYYNFFVDLKNSMILNCETLSDFTGLHYPDILNEIELNYFILSYELNYRFTFKIFVKREDLVISLNELFKNSN